VVAIQIEPDGTLVLLRDLDFRLWAAVLQQAAVVVTPNTAAVHVSSAVGRPVVAVYPGERYAVNSREWAPWTVPCRVLMKDDPGGTIRRVVDAAADLLGAHH
jgi:ADP-heptose:LPS heptosyltransferase